MGMGPRTEKTRLVLLELKSDSILLKIDQTIKLVQVEPKRRNTDTVIYNFAHGGTQECWLGLNSLDVANIASVSTYYMKCHLKNFKA